MSLNPAEPSDAAAPSFGRVAINAVGSQIGWFACVLGAAHGFAPWGAALAVVLVGLHIATSTRPAAEGRLIAIACVLGFAWDSALAAAGIVHYSAGVISAQLAPYWIIVLWALFAATLNLSMRWLQGRPAVGAIFGAVGGPLSFAAGVRLGAASFPDFGIAMTALAIGWAMWVPLLAALAARQRKTGVATPASRATNTTATQEASTSPMAFNMKTPEQEDNGGSASRVRIQGARHA